jgi:hypothetical protein
MESAGVARIGMEEAMELDSTLKEWVREHRVTCELGAWQELVESRVTTVGFELRLFGRHDPHLQVNPGCHKCVAVFDRLRAIALAAFPKEHRPTTYEIDPFDASFHLRPEAEWSPEVQLAVHIVHRDGYLRPVDDCERKCVEEIRNNLGRLGVQARTWSESRAHAAPFGAHAGGSSTTERN